MNYIKLRIEDVANIMSVDEVLHHIHINHEHSLVYLENPKTGCTTIKKSLSSAIIDKDFPSDYLHDNSQLPFVSPLIESSSILIPSTYSVITSYRHPTIRVLSAFLNKIQYHEHEVICPTFERVQLFRQFDIDLNKNIKFCDFLYLVYKQTVRDMNPHWRVQRFQTLFDFIKPDFVIRTDSLIEDLSNVMLSIFGVSKKVSNYLEENPSHATNSEELIGYYIDDICIEIINSIYRTDFDTFDFSPILTGI